MLKLGIYPEKLYRATFIRQYGLCCCSMALVPFRLFCKNLGQLPEFFGQMVYRPPWQKNSRTRMKTQDDFERFCGFFFCLFFMFLRSTLKKLVSFLYINVQELFPYMKSLQP